MHTVDEMALREADSHLKEVLRCLPRAAAKKPKKRKYVHQLRVESRRSEAALALYGDFLPQGAKKRLEKELRKIRRTAGKARDLDVFLELLEKDKTGQNSGALLKIARKHRDKVQQDMVDAGRSARKNGLRKDVRKLLKTTKRRGAGKGLHFAPWARIELRPAIAAFFAAAVPADSALEKLHAFRKSAKALRYQMEMLETAFPPAFKKDLLRKVESLQERLGEINDIATRKRKLEKWLKQAGGDRIAEQHLREHIALDTSRLAQARKDFASWCTPAYLRQLQAGFNSMLTGLTLVAPPQVHVGGSLVRI
jgi:CHAD domain-containing protein